MTFVSTIEACSASASAPQSAGSSRRLKDLAPASAALTAGSRRRQRCASALAARLAAAVRALKEPGLSMLQQVEDRSAVGAEFILSHLDVIGCRQCIRSNQRSVLYHDVTRDVIALELISVERCQTSLLT